MFCPNCGRPMDENNNFCANCGFAKNNQVTPKRKGLPAYAIVLIVFAGVFTILGGVFFANEIGRESLKDEFLRDWSRVEEDNGSYYTLELDFSDDEIEYNFDSFYVDDTINTYEYTILTGNKFMVEGRSTIYTVEFNDEKDMMTITPALTSADEYENWFHFDEY